jgi:hypothetical protein
MIVYAKNSGMTTALGKIDTPIKMIIEHESDLLAKKGGICDWLFNVEKSSRFGETIVSENEFDVFVSSPEGGGASSDEITEGRKKFIEHIQFMKEFIISAEMMEDAVNGIAADAKRRAENFTRAYYKTINKICEHALINATNANTKFAGATLDLTTSDTRPLFSAYHDHPIKSQSNYFYGDILCKTVGEERVASSELFEERLSKLSVLMRNVKDENGDALGYTADTIIIPGNKPQLESIVKKVCGSDGALGNGYNDINLHYGNWNVVVLPNWAPNDNRFMIMSSEANKNLAGNMFFNRVPLTINSWIDHHTGNYIWNGRCRFGVGFGSYKHIMLAVDSAANVPNATKL